MDFSAIASFIISSALKRVALDRPASSGVLFTNVRGFKDPFLFAPGCAESPHTKAKRAIATRALRCINVTLIVLSKFISLTKVV